jgi:hypothetical protein
VTGISASARISKGQGYQGFLRKRAGSSFYFFKGQGTPWEVKGHKGAPWWWQGAAPFFKCLAEALAMKLRVCIDYRMQEKEFFISFQCSWNKHQTRETDS